MTTATILEYLEQNYQDEELLLADGFEDAILGVVEGGTRGPVVCYDYELCVKILVAKGMEEEVAFEWMDFNVLGAYVGEKTPLFLHDWRRREE